MTGYHDEYITEDGIEYEVRVWDDGDHLWYLNGKLHREQGPAIKYDDGSQQWFLNGKLHREDGPATEWLAGSREWWWHGIFLTKEVQGQGIDQLSPEEIRFWLPILAAQKTK